MNKQDGITIEVGDKNAPTIRLCKNDDIKECLYCAVDDFRKMVRSPWKDYVINGAITMSGIILAMIVGHFFF